MFAVPGWSLSAGGPKVETAASSANTSATPATPSRKRKRANKGLASDVTRENVADLWEQIIEHKKQETSSKSPQTHKNNSKRRKWNKGSHSTAHQQTQPPTSGQLKVGHLSAAPAPASGTSPAPPKPLDANQVDGPGRADTVKKDSKKKMKKDQRDVKDTKADDPAHKEAAPGRPPAQRGLERTLPSQPAPPKLTALQASMRAKLISARFRHLNETLYTRPSEEAFKLFSESPDMFTEYHEGFRQQVGVWPESPVDGYIADIRSRAAIKPPLSASRGGRGGRRNHHKQNPRHQHHGQDDNDAAAAGSGGSGGDPLPRTAGVCTIADLGCGDGRLGGELQGPTAEQLRLRVLSFDLQSPAPHVTKADMAALPLADGSVNIAIFCLALMGTNWPAFVEEAYRVLHWKGELWVAEIKSRFSPAGSRNKAVPGAGSRAVVEHSVGNRRKKAGAGKKGAAAEDPEVVASHAEALALEVDGVEDRRGETDVSAFVQVLRRRGFVLHGEGNDAIDINNKMFVKMRFLKASTPVVGKGAPKDQQQAPSTGPSGPGKKKFIDTSETVSPQDEARVLKPCVYKVR